MAEGRFIVRARKHQRFLDTEAILDEVEGGLLAEDFTLTPASGGVGREIVLLVRGTTQTDLVNAVRAILSQIRAPEGSVTVQPDDGSVQPHTSRHHR